MKKAGLFLSMLAVSLVTASAQVTVEVTMEQSQFLPGEALPVAVRITNRSGQALRLGGDADWLRFAMDTGEGRVVAQISEPDVKGAFELQSSEVAIKRLDLAPHFAMSEIGRYSVMAIVRIPGWDREIASPPKTFDMIQGARFWEQEVGVPQPPGATNSIPEVRRYILQQANYLKGRLRMYLRVTDGYGKTVRLVPVGTVVSFSHPEPQVDRQSKLHLIYQNGPSSFSYTVFSLNGEVLVQQTYDYVTSRPRLRLDDAGSVQVIGGIRRVTDKDIPPPDMSELSSQPAPATSPATNTTPVKEKKSRKQKS